MSIKARALRIYNFTLHIPVINRIKFIYIKSSLFHMPHLLPIKLITSVSRISIMIIQLKVHVYSYFINRLISRKQSEPCHRKIAVAVYANSKGSGEPAHARSLARTFAVHSRKR